MTFFITAWFSLFIYNFEYYGKKKKDYISTARTSSDIVDYYYRAKDKFVLISADGPDNNVIKIKPPMCFTKTDGDLLCSVLDEALTEIEEC